MVDIKPEDKLIEEIMLSTLSLTKKFFEFFEDRRNFELLLEEYRLERDLDSALFKVLKKMRLPRASWKIWTLFRVEGEFILVMDHSIPIVKRPLLYGGNLAYLMKHHLLPPELLKKALSKGVIMESDLQEAMMKML